MKYYDSSPYVPANEGNMGFKILTKDYFQTIRGIYGKEKIISFYNHFAEGIFGKSFQGVYPEAPDLFLRAMDLMNITEKNILVIGTQIPWLEAILHFRNPKLGVTVDFKSRERYKS